VCLDRALGIDHETQVPAVAAQPGGGADRVATGVPQRVEHAGSAVELAQAVGAPGQVVGFFLGGVQQVLAGFLAARHRGLAEVERLGADLANVVDARQAGGMAALGVVQLDLGQSGGGVRAGGGRVAEDGLQGALALVDDPVEWGEAADGMHAAILWDAGVRGRQRSASASSSSGCWTGTGVPLARCRRQPMLALSTRVAPQACSWSSRGSRNAAARPGSSSMLLPAAPQQPWPASSSTTSSPGTRTSRRRSAGTEPTTLRWVQGRCRATRSVRVANDTRSACRSRNS